MGNETNPIIHLEPGESQEWVSPQELMSTTLTDRVTSLREGQADRRGRQNVAGAEAGDTGVDPVASEMDAKYGPQSGAHDLRPRQRPDYM